MSNSLKRAIKYNRVKRYWYLEGSNHSEYRQLQNGERLTTTRGSVQYFSNGTKKVILIFFTIVEHFKSSSNDIDLTWSTPFNLKVTLIES